MPVTDYRLPTLLESGRWEMEDFIVMNNTFFRCGKRLGVMYGSREWFSQTHSITLL